MSRGEMKGAVWVGVVDLVRGEFWGGVGVVVGVVVTGGYGAMGWGRGGVAIEV